MTATAVNYHSKWSRGLVATGVRVSEVLYSPNHFCPMHWHEFPSLGIVLKGEISKKFEDSSVVIGSNDAFTLPAETLHTDFFGPGSRTVLIEIDPAHPQSAERLRVCGPIFERWLKVQDQQLRWLGQRLVSEIRRPDGVATLAVDSLVGEILSVATRAATQSREDDIPEWLIEARDIAQSEITRRVSVAEIAGHVGVHPAYLTRRFRNAFGVTPGTFARNARLAWAAARLIDTDEAIAEIAIQAGFSDQSHFTRAFRRFTEQTPAQYRDRHRQNGQIFR